MMPAAVLLNPDDPNFAFEHMMQHRTYFSVMGDHAVQGGLAQFSVLPYVLDPSQSPELPAQSWNLNHRQAHNDFNGDLPANFADGYTLTTVQLPTASGNCTSLATTLLVVNVSGGTIMVGSVMSGTPVPPGILPPGTVIVSQQSGTPGGDGTYITNQPTALAGDYLSFTFPPYQQATPVAGHSFGIQEPGILLEGSGGTEGNQAWWTFLNHQQHYVANKAILPLPTTEPMQAGTSIGTVTGISNPWWWAQRGPVIYPFW
jgi:hypothetical protein